MGNDMRVSVLVMTYNHVRFIAQALESVLMQHTNFAYEIIISEDCSTDGTREIVLEFYKQYPERIRLFLSEQNIRTNVVVVRGLDAAKGRYVALLDGDDYWTATDKLQKQADFLDAHPECAVCFHNATVVHEDGSRAPWNWTLPDHPAISTLEDIWLGNFIATCSTMFRRDLFGEVPGWYATLFPITDWPLHILNAEHGHIGYLNEVMGVYRYHGGGLYSSLSEERKLAETLRFYKVMNRNFRYTYDAIIRIAISKYFFEWAEEYVSRGDLAKARACFQRCLTGKPVNKFISLKRLLMLGYKLYQPLRVARKRLDS
jgi:glycosyltransferase involved in cell wall biosynthesis